MSRLLINGRYDIDYLPTQKICLDCIGEMKTPNIMLCGGFGCGKSRFVGEVGLELMSKYDRVQLGVFRKTRTSIKDTTYKIFLNEVLPPEFVHDWNKTDLEITLNNQSNIHFFGIDNFERKASLQFDAVLVDESTELEEDDHIMLSGRLRGVVLPMPMKIDICNPGAPGSYLHKSYVQNSEKPINEQDKDFKYFCTTSYENIHNPKAYFDRLRKWIGTQYYDRYVLGLWKMFRGTVFEQFDPKIHVIAPFPIPSNWPKWLSVDFGYDHPLVMLWIAQDPGTGQQYVYRQFYRTHCLVKDACLSGKKVTDACRENIEEIIADHDAENRAQFELYWKETIPAIKDVHPGIQTVQELLLPQYNGKPGLFIFNDEWSETDGRWYGNYDPDIVLKEEGRPTNLQEEIPGYKWGPNDKPKKINDDGADSLRYGCHTRKINAAKGGGLEVYHAESFSRR
jgi:PBSX family phage terminase large subunit